MNDWDYGLIAFLIAACIIAIVAGAASIGRERAASAAYIACLQELHGQTPEVIKSVCGVRP